MLSKAQPRRDTAVVVAILCLAVLVVWVALRTQSEVNDARGYGLKNGVAAHSFNREKWDKENRK